MTAPGVVTVKFLDGVNVAGFRGSGVDALVACGVIRDRNRTRTPNRCVPVEGRRRGWGRRAWLRPRWASLPITVRTVVARGMMFHSGTGAADSSWRAPQDLFAEFAAVDRCAFRRSRRRKCLTEHGRAARSGHAIRDRGNARCTVEQRLLTDSWPGDCTHPSRRSRRGGKATAGVDLGSADLTPRDAGSPRTLPSLEGDLTLP